MAYPAFARPERMPATWVCGPTTVEVRIGNGTPPLAPVVSDGPKSPRSIPRPVFEKIALARTELPVVVEPVMATPAAPLKAIVLPAPAAVPPTVLAEAPPEIETPS